MDDLGEKINELLGDEESMKQIMELAQMLGGGSDGTSEKSDSESDNAHTEGTPNISGLSDLFGLSDGLGDLGPDMNTLMQIGSALSSANSSDKNRDLLLALKPHLGEQKQVKVDKAIRLLKLYSVFNVLKEKGLFNNLQ
ncbi:MAG: hypothetical protein LIO69_03785 [Oscillospiraceae bacterium]|nr:hypothetical protein [Oscillospiraceae bacterium]